MDDTSWQDKCGGSTWQPPLLQRGMGYFNNSLNVQHQRSALNGGVPEPILLNNLNKTDSSGLGNSCLGILSVPSSLVQCDTQPIGNAAELAISAHVVTNSSGKGAVPQMNLPLSANLGNRNDKNGCFTPSFISSEQLGLDNRRGRAGTSPVFSTGELFSSDYIEATVTCNDLQTSNINLPSSDLARAADHRIVPGFEIGMQFSSPLDGQLAGFNMANIGVLQSTNFQQLDKSPSGADTSISNQTNTFPSACPRVYCLSKSGSLLLSNTGLLGVVCLCHSMHMSVSKFCEHSGLHAINPGEAVHMDNGMTIARWRKLYSQKFAIRAPEDQSGWDWPQWYSINADLVKSGSGLSNMSNSYDLSSSPRGFVMSGEPGENASYPTKVYSSENLPKRVQHRDNQDECNFSSKSLTVTSRHSSHSRLIGCPLPRYSTMPKFVGNRDSENSLPSASVYSDSLSKFGPSFNSHPPLQYLKTPDKLSNSRNFNNSTGGQILDRDIVSSNIELKLGQPYQQGQTFGNPLQSSTGRQLLDTLGSPLKPVSSVHLIVNKDNAMVLEKNRQYPWYAASTSNSRERTGKIELNIMNYAFQNNNAAALAQLRNDATLAQDGLLKGDVKAPANNLMGISTVSTAARKQHSNFHVAKSSPSAANPLNCDPSLERLCMVNEISTSGQVHNEVSGGFSFLSKLGYGSQRNSCLSCGTDGEIGNLSGFTLHGKNCYSYQLSGLSLNASDAQNNLNYSGIVPCSGNSRQKDVSLPRSSNSTLVSSSRLILPPSEVSMGFSSAGSVISSLIPSLSSKETFDGNSCTVNEDLRMLAAKHMSERVPGLGFTSVGENPEMERLSSLSYAKKLVIDPSTSLEQRRDVNSTNQMDFSEAPLKSLNFNATSRTSDMQKLNPVAGSTNCRNVSSSSQEFPLSSKEAGIPPQDSHDLFVIKPISRRLEASQSNILSSYENKSILKALTSCFNSNCSCPHEKSCPASYCDRIGETSLGALRKQIVGDSHKASLGLAENIMDHGAPTNKDISLEEKRKIDGQTSKNIGFHTFQWKDVPNKAKKVCNLTSIEHPANQLNDKRINGNHDVDSASTKYYVKSVQEVGTFNVSNISSGSSAPAITQDSTEVNNTGSYTMNAQDPGQMNDGILDEGSGIDKYWSSDVDNSHDRGRTDDFSSCKSISRKERSLKALTNQASCTLMSERKLMDQNVLSGLPLRDKSNYPQMNERSLKLRKRKRVKWKILDASVPGTGLVSVSPRSRRSAKWFSGTTKDKILPSDQGITNLCIAASMGCKFERPSLHPAKATLKRKIERACHLGEEVDCEANHVDLKKSKVSCFKRCRHDSFTDSFEQFKAEESDCYDSATTGTVKEVNYKKVSSSKEMNISNRNAKPVALGKFGMISSEKFPLEGSRPAKIVSLSKILKNAKRCTLHEDNRSNTCSTMVLKKALNQCSGRLIHLKEKECENDKYGGSSMEDIYNACFSREKEHTAKLFVSKNEASVGSLKIEDTSNYNGSNGFKCKSVDICERRSCDLTINGTTREHSSSAVDSPFIWSSALKQRKNYRSVGKLLRRKDDGKCHNTKSCTSNAKKSNKDYQSRSLSNSEELCCVCGSSKKDQMNCLIECGRCFIRVHQGCYGVPKVPKDLWYCRPCKTGSVNMICVLCGYGGGAMTRALQSQNNVKSLLRNLDVDMDSKPNEGSLSNLKVDNQARMLDSSVKQWVHMVCGLWTPGTQCPNVNTMSSFNVSGAFKLGASGVCSLCSRAGGSCIQCRVENCSVRFHPWCAHQKGLLQSEIDNVHDGSVGFFGTCALHAMHPLHESDGEPLITDTCPDNDDITCARTEGYKGRKRDGVSHNLHQPYGKGKCLVLQEQLNAWLHINKKKLSTKGLLPISDVDNDCRKEYVRYKQRKGWKNLVVYKSGIHALGIYTSRFICRGAMVVEYVGEIVGLRVSDKRENEYQSGKRLQYKSACYFFKIDKEYVIDATRKGGIGRFVNHSCLPNCVAKVITVRNEKKVVFFAERDIYPGEEITYDYHFNNEDEGKKIPCFCKSINCRRYLN